MTGRELRTVDGLRLVHLGQLWAAYSPSSGETTLLNDEGAAVLEVLQAGGMTHNQLCELLAADSGQSVADIETIVHSSWPRLIEAGLVEVLDTHARATSFGR